MSFSSDLLKQVTQSSGNTKAWGDVNPLVVIGLTESVLDSGATNDGIYKAIRAYSRQLAADVSPDRNPNAVSDGRLQQIMTAFNYLDDRNNFDLALADFKTLRAEDRRETRILQQALASLRSQISSYESRFEELNAGKRKLADDWRAFNKHKVEEPALIPGLEEKIQEHEDFIAAQAESLKETKKEVTRWSTRAIVAETKVESLDRRLSESAILIPELRIKLNSLDDSLITERRLRVQTENVLLDLDRLILNFNKKKTRLRIPDGLQDRVKILKTPILKEQARKRAERKERRNKKLGLSLTQTILEHPDVLKEE